MKQRLKRYWIVLVTGFVAVFVLIGVLAWAQREHERYDRVMQASDAEYKKKLISAKSVLYDRLARETAEKQKAEEAKKAEEAAKAAAASPAPGAASNHRNPASIDVVVNKKNPLIPLDFAPVLGTANCSGGVSIAASAAADLNALCDVAAAAGVPLGASSSYRSYSTQVSTYNYWVSRDGQAAADTYSARPGYSEHQTGLSLDFRVPGGATLDAFTGTAQQQWLAANGWRYGFIQRYTDANSGETGYMGESWHYRYIGRSAAADYTTRGVSSLETYWGIPGGGY